MFAAPDSAGAFRPGLPATYAELLLIELLALEGALSVTRFTMNMAGRPEPLEGLSTRVWNRTPLVTGCSTVPSTLLHERLSVIPTDRARGRTKRSTDTRRLTPSQRAH